MAELYVRSIKNIENVRGPFSRAKLQELANQGKLHQGYEVSLDRQKWVPIAKVKPPLFAAEHSGQAQPAERLRGNKSKVAQRIDLTVVEKYVPSGRCRRPWLMVPLAAVTPVLTYLMMLLGGLLGCVAGFILVGIPGMLLDQFLGGVIQEMTGGWTVRGVGATFGSALGILGGEAAAFWGVTWAFSTWSHNRSAKMVAIFGLMASVLTLAPYVLFFRQSLDSIPSEYQESMGGGMLIYYWVFVVTLALTAWFAIYSAAESVLTSPYCENCNSFVDHSTRSRKYSVKGEDLLDLAKQGAIAPLTKMEIPGDDVKRFTKVELHACQKNCCVRISITYFWERLNRETKAIEICSAEKLKGLLDKKRRKIWKEILREW